MRKIFATLGSSFLAVSALALLTPAPALASYEDEGNSNCQQVGQHGSEGGDVEFDCHFRDKDGKGVEGIKVDFSERSGPGNARVRFDPQSAVSDANGFVKTIVTLPPNSPGSYVLAASTSFITVTATVREGGGFPVTTAAFSAVPLLNWWALALLLGGILITALGTRAMVLRRAANRLA